MRTEFAKKLREATKAHGKILKWPNPILTTRVPELDFAAEDAKVNLLFQSMEAQEVLENTSNGLALAANQIGIVSRFFVVKQAVVGLGLHPLVVNPRVIDHSTQSSLEIEGCLSFPGISENVRRPEQIRVRYQDIEGKEHTPSLSGLAARVFLHETEHLDGKTFLQNLDRTRRFQLEAVARKKR